MPKDDQRQVISSALLAAHNDLPPASRQSPYKPPKGAVPTSPVDAANDTS
jgi:hypothetical protein